MEEPKRLLESTSLSGESRRLLESYGSTPGLPPNVEASVAARVAEAPTAVSGALGAKAILLVVALLGVTAVWWGTREDVTSSDRPVAAVSEAGATKAAADESTATSEIVATSQEAPEPAAPPDEEPEADRAPDATERPARVKKPPREPREARAPPAAAPDPGGLAEELRILDAGKRALEEDPSITLRHVEDHRRRFVNGQLADLRDFLEIRALERRGDHARAKEKTERFLTTHPSSALAKELRSAR